MTPAFKIGGHKYGQHFFCISLSYKPSGYTNDIGIIVFPDSLAISSPSRSLRGFRGAYCRDGHAIGTSAQQDAKCEITTGYRFCYGVISR